MSAICFNTVRVIARCSVSRTYSFAVLSLQSTLRMSLMCAADLNKRILVEGGAYSALKLCKNITINSTIKTGIQRQLETASAAQIRK